MVCFWVLDLFMHVSLCETKATHIPAWDILFFDVSILKPCLMKQNAAIMCSCRIISHL